MVKGGEDPTEVNALEILGADPDVRELASLERLRTMAKAAGGVRRMTEAQRARRVELDSGRKSTLGDAIDGVLAAAQVELDVAPLPVKEQARVMARQGMSVREIAEALGLRGNDALTSRTLRRMVRDILMERLDPCEGCGVLFRKSPYRARVLCEGCARPMCACGCGKRAPRSAMSASQVAERRGGPWVCKKGSARMRFAEGRAGIAVHNASLTPEQMADRARKLNASLTSEQKADRARKGNATRWAKRAAQ